MPGMAACRSSGVHAASSGGHPMVPVPSRATSHPASHARNDTSCSYLPRNHTFQSNHLSPTLRQLLDAYEVLMVLHPTPLHPRPPHQVRVYQPREPHCTAAHLAREVRMAGYCVNTLDNYVNEELTTVDSAHPELKWRRVPHWYKYPIKQMTKGKVSRRS